MRAHRYIFWNLLPLSLLLISSLAWSQNASSDVAGSYVTHDGVRIWYRVEGTITPDSIPLLMLHGGPGATARPFERTIGPEIARNRAVVYMDYRGSGRSDRPREPSSYSFAILASDAEVLRQHLGIERWAVFGHSNGGAVAITYALTYPSHVAALVLCDALLSPADLEMNMIHKVALAPADKYEQARAIYRSGKNMDERFGRLLDLLDMKTRNGFQYYNLENSAVLDQIQGDLSKEIGKGLMEDALIQGLLANGFFEFDAFKTAKSLTMPSLLVLGRYDSEISIDNAMKFAVTVPNGYVAMLNQSGHHPYLEETKKVSETIDDFLSKCIPASPIAPASATSSGTISPNPKR